MHLSNCERINGNPEVSPQVRVFPVDTISAKRGDAMMRRFRALMTVTVSEGETWLKGHGCVDG
jgi:hypothetical protein